MILQSRCSHRLALTAAAHCRSACGNAGNALTGMISVSCAFVWLINCDAFLSWEPLRSAPAALSWLPDPASVRVDLDACVHYFKAGIPAQPQFWLIFWFLIRTLTSARFRSFPPNSALLCAAQHRRSAQRGRT